MTLHEITDKLVKEFPDEVKGVADYCEMAHALQEMGQHEMAKRVRAMAKDEYTHAENIKYLLKMSGVPIAKEHDGAFDMAEKKLEKIYKDWHSNPHMKHYK